METVILRLIFRLFQSKVEFRFLFLEDWNLMLYKPRGQSKYLIEQ